MTKVRTAFLQGSFDITTAAHVRTFKWLHDQLGQIELVIGLNTDELMSSHKPGQPIIPYAQREEVLLALDAVDRVIPCNDPLALSYLEQLQADIFVCGKEWVERQKEAIDWVTKRGGGAIIPPYFPEDGVTMSCSMIRAKIRGERS